MKRCAVVSSTILLCVILVSCGNKPIRKPISTNHTPLIETNYSFENPPVFENQGELQFIDSAQQKVLATINIELSTNDTDRALGLMYRPHMEFNNGMLFIFDVEMKQSFWMRNTLVSLDMLFINSNKEIVTIHKNTPTLTDQSFPSTEPAIYVVEVVGGFCDSLNIKQGDKIVF